MEAELPPLSVGDDRLGEPTRSATSTAGIVHRLMRGYLKGSPLLSEELGSERRDALVLRNGIEVRVFPCTSKARGRGHRWPARTCARPGRDQGVT